MNITGSKRVYKILILKFLFNKASQNISAAIAAALNIMLGVPKNVESTKSCGVHGLVWRWLEVFLKKRYDWDFSSSNYKDVRKFAILRGLCHKVLYIKILEMLAFKVL